MKVLAIVVALVFIVSSCIGLCIYSDSSGELIMSEEYTPSQNLAIYEGRFDDARESIQELNG